MRYVARVGEHSHLIELQENGHSREVVLDNRELTLDWRLVGVPQAALSDGEAPAEHYSLLIGDRSYEAYARLAPDADADGTTIEVMIAGRPYLVTVEDERSRALASLASGAHVSGDAPIRAPMPGLVVNVLAELGAVVERGQTVVVLEAMKMENDLTTPRAGVIKAVRVERGQTVNQGDALVVVGDPEGESPPQDDDE
ncbi:MAG TPA: biotin/lipoyl-containing protein [Ktedonobacterales bacterium]|nr:biotin/lipoyl-containing protein [Ktedonobacterales bacterium]